MKRDLMTLPLDLGNELIIDNFAGGGGTSTGLEWAFGRPVDIAINHDPEALAMHALNHPHTKHLCESVWDVDPIKVTDNQPVGLVWLSPDCKHFSKAKGGTPVSKNIRGLAWITLRWLLQTSPRAFMIENVEEFVTWGELIEIEPGKWIPDPSKKGETFRAFIGMITKGVASDHPALIEACEMLGIALDSRDAKRLKNGLGYTADWKELRACDNGAPTIRKRLFIVGRRDGLPIVFPEATHGTPTSADVLAGLLQPFRTAAECIDFDLPAQSIFDRKKPLVFNSLRRVAKGAWRHVLSSASPFIVGVGGRMGLVESVQVPVDSLAPEHREKARKCAALLHEHLPEQFPDAADMVMMIHSGTWWVLVDITLRMLKARELYRAQSFPGSYIIHEIPDPKLLFKDGVQVPGDPRLLPRIPLTITAQIRMCGNSVAPAQAEALIRTNFSNEREFARAA